MSKDFSADAEFDPPAGREQRLPRVANFERRAWIHGRDHRLHHALHERKIAARRQAQEQRFLGQAIGLRQIDFRRFEQFDSRIRQRLVGPPRAEQAGDQAPPQLIGPPQDRRLQLERGSRCPRTVRLRPIVLDDAQRQGLVKARRDERAANFGQHPILRQPLRRRHRHAHVLRNRVIAVNSRDLLDQVDLPRQVRAPTRWNDFDLIVARARLAIAERQEDFADALRRNLDP